MRNFRGIFIAAVLVGLTWFLTILGKAYNQLIGMAYPFASKTYMEFLQEVTNATPLVVWQVILVIFLVAVFVSFGLMILFRWNLFRWLGCVLAPAAAVLLLWYLTWGLNNFAKPINESMKLEVPNYSASELREATLFYRQQADKYGEKVKRDENGDVVLPELEKLNEVAGKSYDNLVWEYSVFAGPRGPVKALGWSDLFSRLNVDGITIGLTGEAAVNLDAYAADIPFNMCHEMGHLLAFARENEANFCGFMACEYSSDNLFRYSGYLNAYLFCANTLAKISPKDYIEIREGASDYLLHDLEAMNERAKATEGTLKKVGTATNDAFLKANGQEEGIETYAQVTDLLVAWYQARYVIDDTPAPTQFNPYDYDEVFPTEPPAPTEPEETEEA